MARLAESLTTGSGSGSDLSRRCQAMAWRSLLGLVAFACFGCSNSPYPEEDSDTKILYRSFEEAPKNLDPAYAYTTSATAILGRVYDTLLEYHYLKRPYQLIGGIAKEVPTAEVLDDGTIRYGFELRGEMLYQDDPCFAAYGGGATRQVLAGDLVFAFQRLADPLVNSPVFQSFANLKGFAEFAKALAERRKRDPAFRKLPPREQYRAVGGISGVVSEGPHHFELVLARPYPQILEWLAMHFSAPVPWEAVQHYDGKEGRDHFKDHPVGSGPYYLSAYAKESRYVLEKNLNWYGVKHPEWKAAGAVYPTSGAPGDEAHGLLPAEYVGKPLPFIERIVTVRDKESIPAFGKFLQGYYDSSGIVKESFDQLVRGDALSEEMSARGMKLEKSAKSDIFYLGFNMDDPVVGSAKGARSRALRQAMSLMVDVLEYTRVFTNGRGIPAQSPLPPGIFGYDAEYKNPFRTVDLKRAQALMVEAGYPGGIDPKTNKPLRLSFDTSDTSPDGGARFKFFVKAWRQLGISVEVSATDYNRFQKKMREGAFQIFQWGWVADYPDPENFMFLLWSKMSRKKSGGPNTANFSNAKYDELFLKMATRENDDRRMEIMKEMRTLLEHERPWIELYHRESYVLRHGWLKNVKAPGLSLPVSKYWDLDAAERGRRRTEWNRPIYWPAFLLLFMGLAIIAPGIRTFYQERQ